MKERSVPTARITGEEFAVLYARARRARAAAIHDLAVRFLNKLTPRLNVARWGEHWG